MTLNRKLVAIIILSLFAHPAYADYKLDSNREYSIKIPKDDIVRIKVKDDRIAQVFAKSNYFNLENDPKSGTVFLTNLRDKPYSFTFITEKGREQSLRLIPAERGYVDKMLFFSEVKKDKQTRSGYLHEETMSKVNLAKRLGFYDLSEPTIRQENFTVKAIGYRNFKDLRVRKYELSNHQRQAVLKLKPQDLSFNYEVVMTMLEEDTLQPGAKTQLYTVARR
jgi:hypothetical protein